MLGCIYSQVLSEHLDAIAITENQGGEAINASVRKQSVQEWKFSQAQQLFRKQEPFY
jgi:hypothetical protein